MAVGSLLVIVMFFLSSAWAMSNEIATEYISYSLTVGRGLGSPYQIKGDGHITAIRMWEHNTAYIAGLQFQFEGIWSARVGQTVGTVMELELRAGEAIVQISGKWHPSHYIFQLEFVTNRGRFFRAGQPAGYSFNFYPRHPDAELLLVSGRQDGNAISSIGAHWGVIDSKKH